jgi:hypothetical protein
VLEMQGTVWFKAGDVLQVLRLEDTLQEAKEDLVELFMTVQPIRLTVGK